MDPSVQILKPWLKVRFVILPRHAIHAGRGFALERVVRRPERVDVEVVEERSELFLLPLPCGFPYAVQRLGHPSPALCPVRVLLVRVPLGPQPWLHQLRHRYPGFVRRLRRYYARVRLLWIVHQRLRLLTFPPRTIRPIGPMADPEISRFPHKERPYMPGSQTTPGPTGARNNAPADFAFRQVNNVGTRIDNGFAAQWLAYTLPYRRFADVLAEDCARIGGDVDCYSFIAVDSHHILLASLPAHSLALRPAHSRSHQIRDRYPGASDISSPPCLPRLLPAGAIAGWALHPLEKRRLVTAHVDCRPSPTSRRTARARQKRTFAEASHNGAVVLDRPDCECQFD